MSSNLRYRPEKEIAATSDKSSPFAGAEPDSFSRICNQAHRLGFPPLNQFPPLINLRAPELTTAITSN